MRRLEESHSSMGRRVLPHSCYDMSFRACSRCTVKEKLPHLSFKRCLGQASCSDLVWEILVKFGRPRILQSEGHDGVAIYPQWCPERSMFFIIRIHFDLVIPPQNPSMKDIRSNLHVLSIMTSVIGRGNSSLGQASFRSRKTMQIWIFPFFLATETIWLSNQDVALP